jgi:isoleucyl-tRNA synthetase
MKAVGGAIQALKLEDILRLERGETLEVQGEAITLADVEIRRAPREGSENLAVHRIVSIEVDPTVTAEQEQEGLAREVMRKVQMARKAADFQMDDRISLEIAAGTEIRAAIECHKDMLLSETLTGEFRLLDEVSTPAGFYVDTSDIDGLSVKVGVTVLGR